MRRIEVTAVRADAPEGLAAPGDGAGEGRRIVPLLDPAARPLPPRGALAGDRRARSNRGDRGRAAARKQPRGRRNRPHDGRVGVGDARRSEARGEPSRARCARPRRSPHRRRARSPLHRNALDRDRAVDLPPLPPRIPRGGDRRRLPDRPRARGERKTEGSATNQRVGPPGQLLAEIFSTQGLAATLAPGGHPDRPRFAGDLHALIDRARRLRERPTPWARHHDGPGFSLVPASWNEALHWAGRSGLTLRPGLTDRQNGAAHSVGQAPRRTWVFSWCLSHGMRRSIGVVVQV